MRFYLIIIFLFVAGYVSAQHDLQVTPTGQTEYDSIRSQYITGFPDHFFIWPVLKQRRLDFRIQDLPSRDRNVRYISNKPYSLGVGMYVFELVLEITAALPSNEKSEYIFGKSDATDFQVNIFGKKWGLDFYRQKYEGFYISDSEVDIPTGTPYPQRADIRTRNTYATCSYIFNNKKFSFRSAYNYSERQLRSSGSFVLFGSIGGFKTKGDSAILGYNYRNEFGVNSRVLEIKSTNLGLAPGYTYSVIHKGFFINAAVALGPSHNWMHYAAEDGTMRDYRKFATFFIARIGMGYNGEKFFGGLSFSSQALNSKFDTFHVVNSSQTLKVLFGYRFREFGFLKKRIADIPKALGFEG